MVALTAIAVLFPAAALAQTSAPAGSEYVESVPTGSGSHATSTPQQRAAKHTSPAPRHTYSPPVRRYTAPRVAPRTYSAPVTPTPRISSPAPVKTRLRHHKPHHKAAHHAVQTQAPAPARRAAAAPRQVSVAPSSSTSAGDHGFVWLGFLMLAVTGLVLANAHFQRRKTAGDVGF
jgi:hypothetical protein